MTGNDTVFCSDWTFDTAGISIVLSYILCYKQSLKESSGFFREFVMPLNETFT